MPNRTCGAAATLIRAPLLALLLLLPAAAEAKQFCSDPLVPYCIKAGEMSEDLLSADDCRRRVERHIVDLERYAGCLSEMLANTEAELKSFQELIAPDAEKATN